MAAHIHNTFDMVPPLRDILPMDVSTKGASQTFHFGKRRCPKPKNNTMSFKPHDPLKDRSLCPWYHIITSDSDRYPVDLLEIRCRRCKKCLMDNRVKSRCEPVYYPLRVLRKTGKCIDELYEYVPSWQKVAVGCTCACAAGYTCS